MKVLSILFVVVISQVSSYEWGYKLSQEVETDNITQAHVNYSTYMNESLYSGYIPLNVEQHEYAFFTLFESRYNASTDPLIIWFQGDSEPSQYALFLENGPQMFAFDPLGKPAFTVTKNNHSWNNNASVMYVDYPLSSGFSFLPNFLSYRFEDGQIIQDLQTFIKVFLETLPQYKDKATYLFGQGTAARYMALFTNSLHKEPIKGFNLKGVALQNPYIDPFYQLPAHNQYAIDNELVNPARGFLLSLINEGCRYMMLTEIPFLGQSLCYVTEIAIIGNPIYPNFNADDIRLDCSKEPNPCDISYGLGMYLNSPRFRPLVGAVSEWVESDFVNKLITTFSSQYNYGHYFRTLLEEMNIPLLVYSGDKDYTANYIGQNEWTNALVWEFQNEFNKQQYQDWRVQSNDTIVSGQFKSFGPLTVFKVHNASKRVARDQPEVALQMLKEFIDMGTLDNKNDV